MLNVNTAFVGACVANIDNGGKIERFIYSHPQRSAGRDRLSHFIYGYGH